MDIDGDMQKYFGPKDVMLPDEGFRYQLPEPGVSVQIKLPAGQSPHFKFSAV